MGEAPEDRIRRLDIWQGSISVEPLSGGITNWNYLVRDGSRKVAVRLGEDIPAHLISRSNELAASKAAYEAGISPAIVHHEPGILVTQYIEAKTLAPEDINDPAMISRILPVLRKCHMDIPKYFRGPPVIFWVFQVIRDYARTLADGNSAYLLEINDLLEKSARLEAAAGPFSIVFGHNDLLAANFLDDGKRLWLIDWDYCGFNTPLFDLGGLASNNLFAEDTERALLEAYFETAVHDGLWRRYNAMKCASLLRETMWGMVSEIHSTVGMDFKPYTAEYHRRFDLAYAEFEEA
jgi:thiamine kinase-like enzyme